jgi:hypothetical protein
MHPSRLALPCEQRAAQDNDEGRVLPCLRTQRPCGKDRRAFRALGASPECWRADGTVQSMIRKSGSRFSDKIMLYGKDITSSRFDPEAIGRERAAVAQW